MATAKKPESESTETTGKENEGIALPPDQDPSFHVESWPEAYDNPLVNKDSKDAPATDSGTSSSGSGTSS